MLVTISFVTRQSVQLVNICQCKCKSEIAGSSLPSQVASSPIDPGSLWISHIKISIGSLISVLMLLFLTSTLLTSVTAFSSHLLSLFFYFWVCHWVAIIIPLHGFWASDMISQCLSHRRNSSCSINLPTLPGLYYRVLFLVHYNHANDFLQSYPFGNKIDSYV